MGSGRLDALHRAWMRLTAEIPVQPIDWRWIGLPVLAGLAHWFWIHPPWPWALWSGDAHEYAVLARRLAAGEGFTTGVILPVELGFGATADHPSLLRAPLWPLVIAAFFCVLGSEAWAAHVAVLVFHLGTIALATGLAMGLCGRWAGLVAGLAVAASSQLVMFTIDGVSESLFGFLVVLVFLLCARGARGFWIGAACGLAYLTRYNGGVLLGAAGLVLLSQPRPLRALIETAAGFVTVASPWWLRNFLVTGSPFYSLYTLSLYFRPEMRLPNTSLWYSLDPSTDSPLAVHPLTKLRALLPALLARFPLASANLAAFLGVLFACVRRDRLSLAFVFVAGTTTVIVAVALPNGRYLIPFVPLTIVLGCAAFARLDRRIAAPLLALVLLAPLLPTWPPETQDLTFYRKVIRMSQLLGSEVPPELLPARAPTGELVRCLEGRPVVLAQDAAILAWRTDAIAIHLPSSRADFWEIVDRHPVRFVQIRRYPRISKAEFEAAFEARPECGPDVYEFRGRRGR